MFNDQLLAGRRILVTGGGTGLGKSMLSGSTARRRLGFRPSSGKAMPARRTNATAPAMPRQAAVLEIGSRPFAAMIEEADIVVGLFQRLDLARDETVEFVEIADEVGRQVEIQGGSPGTVVCFDLRLGATKAHCSDRFRLEDRAQVKQGNEAWHARGPRVIGWHRTAGRRYDRGQYSSPQKIQTGANMSAGPGKVHTQICDVSDPASVKAAMKATLDTFGRVDGCFANAGIGGGGRRAFIDRTEEEWRRMFATNLDGVFHVFQAAARHMTERAECLSCGAILLPCGR